MNGCHMFVEQNIGWECFQTVTALLFVCFTVVFGDDMLFNVIHKINVLCKCFMTFWTLIWKESWWQRLSDANEKQNNAKMTVYDNTYFCFEFDCNAGIIFGSSFKDAIIERFQENFRLFSWWWWLFTFWWYFNFVLRFFFDNDFLLFSWNWRWCCNIMMKLFF